MYVCMYYVTFCDNNVNRQLAAVAHFLYKK
jgi:hypothetical protein